MAKRFNFLCQTPVIFLTFGVMVFLAGCASLQLHPEEQCNYHAHIRTPIDIYLNKRFPKDAPIRLAVIPFSSPANVASRGDQFPGVGKSLALKVQQGLLASGQLPITQLLNREDWPGKTDEYFSGNFASIDMARHAGFDLVLVGYLNPLTSLDSLSAQAKIIETEGGVTIWSGESVVSTNRSERGSAVPYRWFEDRKPSDLHQDLLINKLAGCLVENALDENYVPG